MAKAKRKTKPQPRPVVGVVMGSDNDWSVMQRCVDRLEEFGIGFEVRVISAHRTPASAHEYAATATGRGLKVIIAAAGMSAALGGVLAANTTLPVIGIPISSGPLGGVDAAISMMPSIPRFSTPARSDRISPRVANMIGVAIRMVALLTDMLVLFETDGMLASSVEVDVTTVEDQWRAVAKVRGEPYDGDRHELLHDIKAATYHTLEVRPDEGWARVLFDI